MVVLVMVVLALPLLLVMVMVVLALPLLLSPASMACESTSTSSTQQHYLQRQQQCAVYGCVSVCCARCC